MQTRTPIPSREVARVVLVVACVVALVAGAFVFRFLLLAASVGVIGGVLLVPWIRSWQRCGRLPRGVATGLVAFTLLSVLGGGIYGVWRLIAGQVSRLSEQAPTITKNFVAAAQDLAGRLPGGGVDLQRFDLGAALQKTGQTLLSGLHIGIEGLAGVVVILMIAIFTASNAESYLHGALTLLPPSARPRAMVLAQGCASVIRRWFTGQLLVLSVTSAMTAIVLGAMGIDYWLVLALLTGLLDFIPFFGAFLTGALAVGVTLGTQPDKAVWVLLAYVAIQQVESDLVVPLVMKGRIQLPEAHLLVFVLLMGIAFGILGVFAAPPLFGVLHYLYGEVYVPWIEGRERRVAGLARRGERGQNLCVGNPDHQLKPKEAS